jgi:biopolymer transport protein ExbD
MIVLPVSDQARPVGAGARIVVEVFEHGAAWSVGFAGKTYGIAGADLDEAFGAELRKAVASEAATPTVFLLRADAKAPYRMPYLAVKAAVEAGLTRILFAARRDTAATAEVAVVWQIPEGAGPPDPNGLPDIRLAARMERGAVFRTFEIDPKPILPGAGGDKKLEGLLRAKHAEQRDLWKVEIPVVVEAEVAIPWQHVIDLVSLGQRAGCTRIELDVVAPREKDEPRAADEPREADEPARPAVDDVEPAAGDPTSRPTADITPPRSTYAVAFEQRNAIELWIVRTDDGQVETRPRSDEWRWQVRRRAYRMDRAGWKGLTVDLARRAGVVGNGLSSRHLLIRADARAPWGLLQKAIEAAALARIYKIHIAAVHDPNVPVEALACWLPTSDAVGTAAVVSEIRLLLSWNAEASRLERLLGQSSCPATPEGDARLESLARESLGALRKEGRPALLIIDAGPLVPCQAIVDALDLARKVGIEHVEFGVGSEAR